MKNKFYIESFSQDIRSIAVAKYPELKKKTKKNDGEFLQIYIEKELVSFPKNKYEIHCSHELLKNSFYKENQQKIDDLLEKFKNGEPLDNYLSNKYGERDTFLYAFGMHHIHIKAKINGNFKNSDELLFFLIRDKDIYFIDISVHKEFDAIPEFLLNIIDKNWPFLLDLYEMKGFEAGHNFDNEEGMNLIKNGATIMYNVNGRCICPIGGGVMTSGHSADSITMSMQLSRTINFYRKSLEKSHKKIIKSFRKKGISHRILKFGIKEISNNHIQFYEKQSNTGLNLT